MKSDFGFSITLHDYLMLFEVQAQKKKLTNLSQWHADLSAPWGDYNL